MHKERSQTISCSAFLMVLQKVVYIKVGVSLEAAPSIRVL